MRRALPILLALLLGGCFRTHYENFSPANPNQSAQPSTAPVRLRNTGWQHFFIWGWVPSERPIVARELCGSGENVAAIETRQTFVEGLVAQFAGYYINIYSPWDGAVLCKQPPQTIAPAPAATPAPAPSGTTPTPTPTP